jgi:cullin-associated NEDD8-dissociated protein 1
MNTRTPSTPAITTATLNNLLEKTSHYDKDERYMATSDLCVALGSGILLDEIMEKKICTAILKQLDDKSNDVQSMAVKCLGTLLKKVQHGQVSEICGKLCSLILQGQSELRDIYSIGLKTLIADVPDTMGPLVVEKLTERLMTGIDSDIDDVKRESLDNMTDLLKRFGHLMKPHHETIFRIVFLSLESNKKHVIRKRASVCLGSLAVVVSDSLLFTLVNDLLQKIDTLDISSNLTTELADDIRIIIQTIGTISRTVGYRLGKSLNQIIPLFIKCCGGTSDLSDLNETQEAFYNDLREHCFPGLESFILRCPNEIAPHVPAILQLSIHYMKYDPNYCYDENDEENEEDEENDEDEEDEEEDEDGYGGSDDDDSSWKIRKSTIKVIQAIAMSRVEIIQNKELFLHISNELLGRFKEREESVRIEIVHCLTSLFNTAYLASKNNQAMTADLNGLPATAPSLTLQRSSEMPDLTVPILARQSSREKSAVTIAADVELNPEIIDFLLSRLSFILRLSRKQLSSQSLKIKSPVYKMLETLVKLLRVPLLPPPSSSLPLSLLTSRRDPLRQSSPLC